MVAERELVDKWLTQVFRPAEEEVRRLLRQFPDRRQLPVSYEQCGTDYRFTAPLVSDPDRTLEAGREALTEFVDGEVGEQATVDADDRIYLRVTDVPDGVRIPLASLGADHLNRLVAVEGRVEAVEDTRPRIVTAAYRCTRCGDRTDVVQRGARFRGRSRCQACNTAGTLELRPERSDYVESRRIRLADGDRSVAVSLEHDLVDAASAGDDLGVVAIPRARPDGESTTVDVELEALSVEDAH